MSLSTFFRSRIFIPLGMNDTSFELTNVEAQRLVALHRRRGTCLQRDGRPDRYQPFVRDGGLLSTADD